MQAQALEWRRAGRRVGLVPTMGALHEGHLSLVRAAAARADTVVVSLFVNPTQFGPHEDLSSYPRDPEGDLEKCRALGVEAVFAPSPEAMYDPDASTVVEEQALSAGLCGERRPGHFRGVTTVVAKLFNLVLPTVAVFGLKDYQQALVIRRMVRDLKFPVELVLAPTVREPDGLAMSSRNRYLTTDWRRRALAIPQALAAAAARVEGGERSAAALCAEVREQVRAAGLDPQYVEAVDAETLLPVTQVKAPVLLAVAAYADRTRLIDNRVLVPRG